MSAPGVDAVGGVEEEARADGDEARGAEGEGDLGAELAGFLVEDEHGAVEQKIDEIAVRVGVMRDLDSSVFPEGGVCFDIDREYVAADFAEEERVALAAVEEIGVEYGGLEIECAVFEVVCGELAGACHEDEAVVELAGEGIAHARGGLEADGVGDFAVSSERVEGLVGGEDEFVGIVSHAAQGARVALGLEAHFAGFSVEALYFGGAELKRAVAGIEADEVVIDVEGDVFGFEDIAEHELFFVCELFFGGLVEEGETVGRFCGDDECRVAHACHSRELCDVELLGGGVWREQQPEGIGIVLGVCDDAAVGIIGVVGELDAAELVCEDLRRESLGAQVLCGRVGVLDREGGEVVLEFLPELGVCGGFVREWDFVTEGDFEVVP